MAQKLIDETGNKYGKLTVLSLTKDKNNRTAWLCQCDCGNTKIVRGSDLRTGKIISCGCNKGKHPNNIRDITNEKFGMLTAIKYEYSLNEKQYWSFLCDCGKTVIKQKAAVINGNTCSCGCYSSTLNSLHKRQPVPINEIFGLQKVIKDVTSPEDRGGVKVLCECIKCHRQRVIPLVYLKSYNTYSCTCCTSYPEFTIETLLKELDINFSTQQTMPNLLSQKGRPLKFDFSIKNENNTIVGFIEYNGEQHYKAWDFDTKEENLQTRQERDMRKIQYCKNNNFPLLILNKDSNKKLEIENFLKQLFSD